VPTMTPPQENRAVGNGPRGIPKGAPPVREFDFQIIFTPDEDGINALEPPAGTTSWGSTLTEARTMIAEALELYLHETGWEQT